MFFTKVSIFVTVLATFVSCYLDNSAPYFPIEISRTATGPIAKVMFPLGVLISCTVSIVETKRPHVPFLGFFLLALVDDKQSWQVHMLGVLIMGLGLLREAIQNGKVLVFCLIACIYMGRLVLKAGVTYHHGYPKAILVAKEIMFTGRAESPQQLLIFKLCGLLQWVVLYGWMELYSI